MPKNKHGVKPCPLTKCGTARAQLKAPVCNIGGLALARPAGENEKRRYRPTTFPFSLFPFHCYLLPVNLFIALGGKDATVLRQKPKVFAGVCVANSKDQNTQGRVF